jgi:hypothetical protein
VPGLLAERAKSAFLRSCRILFLSIGYEIYQGMAGKLSERDSLKIRNATLLEPIGGN